MQPNLSGDGKLAVDCFHPEEVKYSMDVSDIPDAESPPATRKFPFPVKLG